MALGPIPAPLEAMSAPHDGPAQPASPQRSAPSSRQRCPRDVIVASPASPGAHTRSAQGRPFLRADHVVLRPGVKRRHRRAEGAKMRQDAPRCAEKHDAHAMRRSHLGHPPLTCRAAPCRPQVQLAIAYLRSRPGYAQFWDRHGGAHPPLLLCPRGTTRPRATGRDHVFFTTVDKGAMTWGWAGVAPIVISHWGLVGPFSSMGWQTSERNRRWHNRRADRRINPPDQPRHPDFVGAGRCMR